MNTKNSPLVENKEGRKTALITGATSGIGRATAHEFAKQGINLILCGRRQERLDAIQHDLEKQVDVHTLNFDVRDKKATFEAIESLPENFKTIDILINNAGNAHGLDPIQTGDTDDWDAMMDINVKGLLYVSRAIIPQMTERQTGQIINIGSSAGKEVYPKGNVYCASKHAVLAITEGMRIDLNPFGIKVGAINPGLVETEFSQVRFKGDTLADNVYKGFKALQPEDIADIIYFAISRPAHVNIADMLVLPTAQASSTIIKKTN
ncbi:NADP-dependent 3-hydroxy acid dehydrogenase YdfG [Gelidibacter algens]|uniref:NADP-dependent 3-hydroxy acid dehydrogenase YdfG n=1 Tax=Gelidibacter algens TaxID=49280 RepID=A0A1A7R4F6_9FLAO|nr:SDR family NAD(P)-dependent oxidoreductase [Gelidibacter algens]OBX26354.1 NAD(P)-dependent oxidoreductase [Gelidibacter algens]RAJ25866.1 NADP-dependent 3-hydroxy acid dehydrogenase YdfG [Gelidibacter algens]